MTYYYDVSALFFISYDIIYMRWSYERKKLDSSNIEYEEINKPTGYIKQLQWDMAIGLQEVDNLNLLNI